MLPLGLGTHQSSPQKPPGPRTQASAPQDTVWRGVRSAASSPSGTGLPSHLHQPGHVLSVTQQRCISCHSQPWHTASPQRTALSQLRGHAGAPGGTCCHPGKGQRREGLGAAVGYPALQQSAAPALPGRAQLGLSAPAKAPCEGTLIGDTTAHRTGKRTMAASLDSSKQPRLLRPGGFLT